MVNGEGESAYRRMKLDIENGALERGLTSDQEVGRRAEEMGFRVVSPEPEWRPNRIQRIG